MASRAGNKLTANIILRYINTSRAFAKETTMHRLRKPYLLFLGDVKDKLTAKTGFGLKDWCGGDVIGERSLPGCSATLRLERLSPREAAAKGAGSIVVGIAPTGGSLP